MESKLSVWFENYLFGDNIEYSTPRVITVIGSGGKTTLIWHLASSLGLGRKILVAPTTKMFLPPNSITGVTLAGIFNEASGKLEALPDGELNELITCYDLALLEGDGSKGLPLKAWSEDEPVVHPATTTTIGLLPLWPLGKPVCESLVHRLPLFLSLTGAAEGEALKSDHLLRLITNETAGLFAKARGEKLLFFNQAEDATALKQACELVENLPDEFRRGLSAVIAGSVREDRIE